MNVRLTDEQKIRILDSEDVYKVMQQVLLRENKIRRNQEHFWVVGLDNQHKILFIELISLGASNRVQVSPPEIFRVAIYKLATQMILVHNHPSGEIQPSDGDKDFTDKLINVGKIIKINVTEHLIISEKEYLSFVDEGIYDELKNNGRYELVAKDKADVQEVQKQMAVEKAERDKAIQIAKKMIEKGYDTDTIKELTGLKKWQLDEYLK